MDLLGNLERKYIRPEYFQCNWAGVGRVSAGDHLSPNYLVITPHCSPPFTGPSHEVLFLPTIPRHTYQHMYTTESADVLDAVISIDSKIGNSPSF